MHKGRKVDTAVVYTYDDHRSIITYEGSCKQKCKKRTLIMISRSHVNIPRGLEMKLSFLFKKPKRQGNCLSKTRQTRNALSFVKALRHVVVKTTFPQEKSRLRTSDFSVSLISPTVEDVESRSAKVVSRTSARCFLGRCRDASAN